MTDDQFQQFQATLQSIAESLRLLCDLAERVQANEGEG